MNAQPKQPPKGGQVRVHLPPNLDPVYANFVLITHSFSEIVIDFSQLLPQTKQAKVKSRVIMTPANAKLMHRALGEHLQRFETQHGEIKMPEKSTLADQLFRSPDPEPPPDEDKK
jgi:hypothetical protein